MPSWVSSLFSHSVPRVAAQVCIQHQFQTIASKQIRAGLILYKDIILSHTRRYTVLWHPSRSYNSRWRRYCLPILGAKYHWLIPLFNAPTRPSCINGSRTAQLHGMGRHVIQNQCAPGGWIIKDPSRHRGN